MFVYLFQIFFNKYNYVVIRFYFLFLNLKDQRRKKRIRKAQDIVFNEKIRVWIRVGKTPHYIYECICRVFLKGLYKKLLLWLSLRGRLEDWG